MTIRRSPYLTHWQVPDPDHQETAQDRIRQLTELGHHFPAPPDFAIFGGSTPVIAVHETADSSDLEGKKIPERESAVVSIGITSNVGRVILPSAMFEQTFGDTFPRPSMD